MDFSVTGMLKGLGKQEPAAHLPGAKTSQVGEAFSGIMQTARESIEFSQKYKQRVDQAEKAAGDLTSNALILPMLKQLRRSVWNQNTLFSGGIGEKTFGPEFDMQIADRIAHSPRLGVKTALASRLMQRSTQAEEKAKLDIHG
jgi:hypothetical protein